MHLAELLLNILEEVACFQLKIFNTLENRIFFLKILNFNSLIDVQIFSHILKNLLLNWNFYFFSYEVKFLSKLSFDLDLEYSVCIKFYNLQGFIN